MTMVTGATGGDSGQQVWFVAWAAHALAHGLNPLTSSAINVPHGIHLLSLTSFPALSALFAPVTWVCGPIFSYNLIGLLGPVVSALSLYVVSWRWVTHRRSRFAAGLLFGFSPFVAGQSQGHFFLTWIFLLPIMAALFDEILVRQSWGNRRAGLLLAFVVIFQLGIALEPLADFIVVAVPVLAWLWLKDRGGWRLKSHYAVASFRWALVLLVPAGILFVFLWLQAGGGSAYRGSSIVANLSADALSFILPGSNQILHFGFAPHADSLVNFHLGTVFVSDSPENGSYLGLPLLLLLFLGVVRTWRQHYSKMLITVAGVAILFELGSHLRLDGHDTWLNLPFRFFASRLGFFLQSLIAIRFSMVMWLAVALLVGRVLDQLWTPSTPRLTRVAIAVLSLATMLSLLPDEVPASPINLPPWFASSVAKSIPPGSTVLTYPISTNGEAHAMLWQALKGFAWNIPVGEAGPQTQPLPSIAVILNECKGNIATTPSSATMTALRQEMYSWNVQTVVVFPFTGSVCARHVFTALLGQGRWVANAETWTPNRG